MNTRAALHGLRQLVARFKLDGVTDRPSYRDWRKKNEPFIQQCLGYTQLQGMPYAGTLFEPDFHADRPLVLLNYTSVAHNTLHHFKNGWADGLRLCRGIVFDTRKRGTTLPRLVAMPYPKFFNYGEHDETLDLPEDAIIDATVKQDGHLLITFEHDGDIIGTTRGRFASPTAKRANALIASKPEWKKVFPKRTTVLFEFIDPSTHVHVDYGDVSEFILTGALDRMTHHDQTYDELEPLAALLGVRMTPRWTGTFKELLAMVKDKDWCNEEGYVARLPDRRVKFKRMSYVARMIADKMTQRSLMTQVAENRLAAKLSDLPYEAHDKARPILEQLLGVQAVEGKKQKVAFLLGLAPEEDRTQYHRTICSKFLKRLEQLGTVTVDDLLKLGTEVDAMEEAEAA